MLMLVDLHIHTTASDGRLSPRVVVDQAKKCGIGCIAITDHDTLAGYLSLERSGQSDVTIIPGIEFSTDLPKHEVHILGYGINSKDAELCRYIELLAESRRRRVAKMIAKLQKLSFEIEEVDVARCAGKAISLGRPHVAQALVDKGYFASSHEAFEAVLGKNKSAYVPHYKLTPQEVIALIKNSGGVPVLAHPGLVGCDTVVMQLIRDGIKGLEVYHPKHSRMESEHYLELAEQYGLIVSGGSDYHAIPGRYPETLGEFRIEKAWLRRFPW